MADYTDEVQTDCERDVVFAVDVLDVGRHLQITHISLDETLSRCGFGSQKCSYLETWINKRRAQAGKDAVPNGTVTPATTIREVIDYVC